MYPDLNNQKNKINNKENSFLKNSSIYLISTIVTALTAFITLPIYTRYLSPSDFGILALFGIFGMVTSRLLSLGITAATYRYYFDYKDDLFNFKVLNSTNLIFILLIFIASGFCIYKTAFWFSSIIFDNQISEELISLSFFSGCIGYLFEYITNLLTAQNRAYLFSWVTISKAIVTIGLSFYFIFVFSLTYMARIYAILITETIMVLILLFFIRDLVGFHFSSKNLKKSIRFSYPLIPRQIVGMIYASFDKTFLNKSTGLVSVGYYTFGAQFATIIKWVLDSVRKTWNPFFLEKAHQNTKDAKQSIVSRFYELAFLIMFCGLGIIYFSEELIKVLTTEEFYPSMYVVPVYVYYYLFGIVSMLGGMQIMHAEKMSYLLPAVITSTLINIVLNILLIPYYGAIGAAIATAIAALVSCIINQYLAQRIFPLPFGAIKLIKLYLLITVFASIIYPLMMAKFNFFIKIFIKLILLSILFSIGLSKDYISWAKIKEIINRIFQRYNKLFIA